MHEQGYLYKGHRSTEWCPRCGTSISAHELVGSYEDRTDPSLFVRFPLLDRPGQSLAVWTTTPWTLPANVAAAVNPEAEYGLRAGRRVVGRRARPRGGVRRAGARAPTSSASATRARSTTCPRRARSSTASSPGRTCPSRRARASCTSPRAAAPRTSSSPASTTCPVLMPVDEAGRFYTDYGWLHGLSTVEAAEQIVVDLGERGKLISAGEIEHRFPFCWRCHTPLIFRIADDWFIAVEELRPKLIEANATVALDARVLRQAHGGLAPEHGRLEHLPPPLLRPAAPDLPLRVRPPDRRRLEGRAGGAGHRAASSSSRSCTGPGSTRSRSAARPAGTRTCAASPRSATSGSTPASSRFSTLGWENPEWVEHGYATGASAGLSGADLPDHAYWETWFPADWVSEMREQIRLWFYSQLFMSRGADRPRPVPGGARLREDARRARPGDARLLGEHDRRRGRLRAHGRRRHALAVLRAAARPQPPLRLRAGERDQEEAADALELRALPRRLREHRGLRARVRRPRGAPARRGLAAARPLARRADAGLRRRGDRRRSRTSSRTG